MLQDQGTRLPKRSRIVTFTKNMMLEMKICNYQKCIFKESCEGF
jgi:hypothetical protein